MYPLYAFETGYILRRNGEEGTQTNISGGQVTGQRKITHTCLSNPFGYSESRRKASASSRTLKV